MSGMLNYLITSLAWSLPGLSVWIVGVVIALARWKRHPEVSSLVAISLAIMIAATLAARIAVVLLGIANPGPTSAATLASYFAVIDVVMVLLRTTSWAALIAAIFGWRTTADGSTRAPLQFGIRGLLILTLAVAILCVPGRAAVAWFAEMSPYWIQLLDDTPVVICLLVGLWIAIVRWSRHRQVSRLALVGFAMSLVVTAMVNLVNYYGELYRDVVWVLAGAGGWAFAIAAAFGWRKLDDPFQQIPADQPFAIPPGMPMA